MQPQHDGLAQQDRQQHDQHAAGQPVDARPHDRAEQQRGHDERGEKEPRVREEVEEVEERHRAGSEDEELDQAPGIGPSPGRRPARESLNLAGE